MSEFSDSLIYVVSFMLLIGVCVLGFWFARESFGVGGSLFNSKQRRLGLVEATSLDGRRRLLLVRRDNVEHLIMTGGPIDVVIETGIAPQPRPALILPMQEPNAQNGPGFEHRLGEETPIVLSRDQAN
jgi:hypothetical protein